MAFGITSGNFGGTATLKVFFDAGYGWQIENGNLIELVSPAIFKGWFRAPGNGYKVAIYLNGQLANEAFEITIEGKLISFDYLQEITLFEKPITLEFEIYK